MVSIEMRDLYHNKIALRGTTPRERNLKDNIREFKLYFRDALNKYTVTINDHRVEEVIFQDHSQSNNKDLSDDKYVIAGLEADIKVGDYIKWDADHWLVFTNETKTIKTHLQSKVKEVNERIKWIRRGDIVNDGVGWYAYVQSQTLYTLGVKTTQQMQLPDAKMTMYLQANDDVLDLRMGERIFIGNRVYTIYFIDTVSRRGLVNMLLEEDSISPYDNVELGVADYYRYYDTDDDITNHPVEDGSDETVNEDKLRVYGDEIARISRQYTFTASKPVTEWVISHTEVEDPYYISGQTDTTITVKIKDDSRYIGSIITIIGISETETDSHSATISVKY